uniref:HIPL1 protein-like n=1 Tax=Erigeron canadensis TaxID=72917 RepID=UPI001CB8D74A|nr:HIPL1 protein-like [Erigeron canadensis]
MELSNTWSNKRIHDEFDQRQNFHALVFGMTFGLISSPSPPICTDSSQSKLSFNNVTKDSNATQPPKGICLEKIGNSTYVHMVPHPDGSNRVFVCNQKGKIWLAVVPEVGSSQSLMVDESDPYLDLSDQVKFATEMGLMSMAVHPNFTSNGRFFVAFNCDKFQQPGCEGRCSCNTHVGCDPAKLESLQESYPCQFHIVISEFTANGTTASSKLSWKGHANSVEVRRIFTMGLPFEAYHAGQIIFGPTDGYLYFMIGDASHDADLYNFAQNKNSLIGKILRLNVDIIPSVEEISKLGLWGNYSIPKDNPYTADKELEPEIWALGFSNPWRCSFDSEKPSRFVCGDCGKNRYEEIDIVKKGGNYGWRVYEGPYPTHPLNAPGGYTQPTSITPIFPVTGYNHDIVDASQGPASVSGGYFYRASTDPCLYGWYVYTDLYLYAIWAAIETTENNGNFTSFSVPFTCAHDSPMDCKFKPGAHGVPDLGYVLSLSEDNNKDVYLLTSSGVYRVAAPSRCGYQCSKENYSNLTRVSSSHGTFLKAAALAACLIISFVTSVFL